MNETCQAQPAFIKMSWVYKLRRRIGYRMWWLTKDAAWWLHSKLEHCHDPEYFKAHPKMVRWTGGLKTFLWSWICGSDLKFSLHLGNIYWKL